ncbi:hypothetical protein CDAR_17611 [Caerostris darwini]|uniref:Uncharacterized protein n=1 Tax=Caerostris darwini TaxID=1538125 RepID=A0AAV4T555_9ARAC|nr:hypothetical protein CDAR_17611 [Caerostris darwini]
MHALYSRLIAGDSELRLSVALPEPYGHYRRVIGQIEVKRREEDWLEYFRGQNWRVHPDCAWINADINANMRN